MFQPASPRGLDEIHSVHAEPIGVSTREPARARPRPGLVKLAQPLGFQPASPRGLDCCGPSSRARSTSVSTREPARARLIAVSYLDFLESFNPRAREGSTDALRYFLGRSLFQPASPRGLDQRACNLAHGGLVSTREPARARRRETQTVSCQKLGFNPRAREGSTVRICIYTHILIIIFILDNQSAP